VNKIPHVCPRCDGERKLPDGRICPTCQGVGIVWGKKEIGEVGEEFTKGDLRCQQQQ
jgi:DnaJ-class molecular chaperone